MLSSQTFWIAKQEQLMIFVDLVAAVDAVKVAVFFEPKVWKNWINILLLGNHCDDLQGINDDDDALENSTYLLLLNALKPLSSAEWFDGVFDCQTTWYLCHWPSLIR